MAAVTLCWSSIHLHWTQSSARQFPKRNFKMIDLLLNQERASLLRFKEYQRSCVTRHIVEQKQWSLQITGMSGLRDHLSLVAGSRHSLQLSIPNPVSRSVNPSQWLHPVWCFSAINTLSWIRECPFTVGCGCKCDSQCVHRPECWTYPAPN